MRKAGQGEPPCPYALAVLGSAGRGESLLAMDQDNALVFAEGEPGGAQDRWFEKLGIHVADILHEVGVPYCKGGVMAKNPQWRGSLATWRERVKDGSAHSRPADLLAVDIFFDLRGVHGDGALADTLWRAAFEAAAGRPVSPKCWSKRPARSQAGLGLFGGFKTSRAASISRSTACSGSSPRRARSPSAIMWSSARHRRGCSASRRWDLGGDSDLEALAEAQALFLHFVLAQQIEDIHHGRPPSNAVLVKQLSARDRERLRAALEAVAPVDELTRDLLFES